MTALIDVGSVPPAGRNQLRYSLKKVLAQRVMESRKENNGYREGVFGWSEDDFGSANLTRREQWTGFDELDIDLYPPL